MSTDPTGPDEEFDVFYREHYTDVRRFTLTLVGDADVDDIVSTTFTTAWQKFDQIPSSSERGWLFGTARNMARNRRASNSRANSLVEMIIQARPRLTSRLAAGGFDPVEVEPLLGLIRGLDDDSRELMIMAGWFEMTPKEIAMATGDRAGNVRVKLHRLRKRLHPEYQDRLDGGVVA